MQRRLEKDTLKKNPLDKRDVFTVAIEIFIHHFSLGSKHQREGEVTIVGKILITSCTLLLLVSGLTNPESYSSKGVNP